MSNRGWVLSSVFVSFLIPAYAQPVVSARAGLIQYADGVVFLDSDVLHTSPGRFEQMKEGAELRTLTGRVELILTPGVFLRLGENSAIRMVSNQLADTRVRFVTGGAIVDASSLAPKTSVTILKGDYEVRLLEEGRYRFNSDPADLRVETGKAVVLYQGKSLEVNAKHVAALSGQLTAKVAGSDPKQDSLDQWDQTRSDSVAQSNQDAQNTKDLATAIDDWQNDPASALSAQGMSGYLPPPGYIPTAPYTTWYSNPYMPLTPFNSFGMMNPWAFGYPGYYGFYGIPVYRNSIVPRSSFTSGSMVNRLPGFGVRPVTPGTGIGIGVGTRPSYIGARPGFGVAHPVAPAPVHVGGAHAGGAHAGGHR
jgi:hypothetical protein